MTNVLKPNVLNSSAHAPIILKFWSWQMC